MTIIETDELAAVPFDVPASAPLPYGLYQHVNWVSQAEVPRWLANGVAMYSKYNYDLISSYAKWEQGWCASADDVIASNEIKEGEKPELEPTIFVPATIYGWDRNECSDLFPDQIAAVKERARRALVVQEEFDVETDLAATILADWAPTTTVDVTDPVHALTMLEAAIGEAHMPAVIHVGVNWATSMAANRVIHPDGNGGWKSTMGHQIIFADGYTAGFGYNKMAATSPIYGWRTPVEENSAFSYTDNEFVAVAERSVLIGYEKLITVVEI